MGLQQHRAERRAQRQGDDDGDDRRGGDGHRELGEEQARDAADEGRGNEHRAQRQRDGDQRRGHLVHRLVRGFARGHAHRHVPLDVLDHDDGVVHHDAHRQDQAEHRQVVDRDAEGGQDWKVPISEIGMATTGMIVARQVCRNRNTTPTTRAIAMKIVSMTSCDRLAHEGRRIVDFDVVQARREALLELRHLVPDRMLDLHDVRARRGDRKPRGGRVSVRVSDGAVVHRAELDAADVADAGDASLFVRLDDDVAELLGRRQSAERLDVDLVGRVGRDRRRIEHARRDLGVLRTQRAQDLAGADVVRGSLVRIDPDPHRVLALAEQLDIRHARQARDLVADLQHVVRHVFGAARAIRRIHVHAEQQRLDGLLDLHALSLHFLRQPGQRVLRRGSA